MRGSDFGDGEGGVESDPLHGDIRVHPHDICRVPNNDGATRRQNRREPSRPDGESGIAAVATSDGRIGWGSRSRVAICGGCDR